MFKPTLSTARAIARSLPRPQILNNTLGRRRLHSQAQNKLLSNASKFTAVAGAVLGGTLAYQYLGQNLEIHAESVPLSEEKKASLSAQHVQVKSSLEHPGVYAWGDNTGKVIAPSSKEKDIKTPRRIRFFDNVLLRDLQLSQNVGVAVNDKGDVLQWGIGYDPNVKIPEFSLRGKNIERVALTKDKVVALSKDKIVYTFPISKELQHDGAKPSETSWVPGTSSKSEIAYRTLEPTLGYFEGIRDIAAGRDHCLILTTGGRVFSSAASFDYPSKGQLGIPGLQWSTRPTDKPYDVLHEISGLKDIQQVAAGDYHSVALDKNGRAFTFGDNLNGQLGLEYSMETDIYDEPQKLKLSALYPDKTYPKVTRVAAGGRNTYFMVDVDEPSKTGRKTTVEVLACGTGIHGNLGNGRWTHIQGVPTKIKALSNLSEYDDRNNTLNPIRLRSLHVGATHAAAVMSNATNTGSRAEDLNFGADVLWWGNNEHYQLGTGKRNNSNVPVYIQPLDGSPVPGGELGFTGSSSRGGSGHERTSGIIGGVDRDDSGRATAGHDQVHRFQITPEGKTSTGRKAAQTIVCGQGNTAVFMKCV
ncbi:regulator of chromosome condensation 1/beta-lactamase-inhibitor protein II [Geopyxis carbonaria]|nr:regulator of chromosome condensation 1/beta-lactamase-inhibitor protein II [Geopyxis carbonaria]